MKKVLQNVVLITIFLAVLILMPDNMIAKPWKAEQNSDGWGDVTPSSPWNHSQVKRIKCDDKIKCNLDNLQCQVHRWTARYKMDSSCDGSKNCLDEENEETCDVNWSDYFTLHAEQWRSSLYTDYYLQSRTLNTCISVCLELYGCQAVQYQRKRQICMFYFDEYNILIPQPEYDVYILKNTTGPVACASNEYRCSPRKCVPVRWLCDGEEDCINGKDEEGCSLMTGIFTKTRGQDIFPVQKVEKGLSLEGCAKFCTEEENQCSSFSYEEDGKKCSVGCTECGYKARHTSSNSTDLYTLGLSQGAEYTDQLLMYFSDIGKILPVTECSTTPHYGSYRTRSSIPQREIKNKFCIPTACALSNGTCLAERDLHKCSINSLCLFVGERGRILDLNSANEYTTAYVIHVVACSKHCLEQDGCRGFAYNYVSHQCYTYFDIDSPSIEASNVVLYTLRRTDRDFCKKGEYQCSAGQCISPHSICDGEEDCNNGKDEQRCDAVKMYKDAKKYQVVTSEGEDQERRIWEMVTVEICAKLCQDDARHCRFFSYIKTTQLCVLGCTPESACRKTNRIVQNENSTVYYRERKEGNSTNSWPVTDNYPSACQEVHYYGSYQDDRHSSSTLVNKPAAPLLEHREGDCRDNVSQCVPSLCLHAWQHCDGKMDCPTGKDEHKCDTSRCFFSLIMGKKMITQNSKAWFGINLSGCAKVCLEMEGCLGFAHSEKGRMMCWFYFDWKGKVVKDPNYDLYCLRNADKDLCPKNTFKCSHAQCISKEAVCDGKEDCSNGRDEDSCESTPAADMSVPTASCGQREVDFDPSLNQSATILKIIGGVLVPYGAYPWQAQIKLFVNESYHHNCGGTIVSAHHILTAAHCVINVQLVELQVVVGQHDVRKMDKAEQSLKVQNINIHGNYSTETKDNDIALLRVWPKIQFSKYVQPACLPQPDTPYEPGTSCQVSGWGKVDSDAPNAPESASQVLRAVAVPLVSDCYCQSYEVYHSKGQTITDNMVCAGYIKGGIDTCRGDSGGPLVCEIQGCYTVMGIVSFGFGCGKPLFPGVYVRVSRYLDWIQQHMQL